MLGFVAAVAVATILAVVSALTLSTSGAIAHDFYANWVKRGHVDGKQEVWIARVSAVVIGVLAIALGILAQGVNVAVLVILAICVAASANFPVLILSLFWRRFNTGGVVGGMSVGLDLVCGARHDRTCDARRGRVVAAGQSDRCIFAARLPRRGARHTAVGSRRRKRDAI